MIKNNKQHHVYNIFEYILFFFGYAGIGYLYETILEVIIYRWGFSNRGVLFGPWLPIYGVGGIVFVLLWYRLIRNKPIKKKLLLIPAVFLLTMATATILELLTSYILEWTMGSWPWQTYIDYDFNFQGRIALSPSIRFGLGGVLFLYFVQPFFEKIVKKIGRRKTKIIAGVLLLLILLDMIYSFIAA